MAREAAFEVDEKQFESPENEAPLSKEQLLNSPQLNKFLHPRAREWAKAFYDEEPRIGKALQRLTEIPLDATYNAQIRGKVLDFIREIYTSLPERAGQLFKTHPSFQEGHWEYLKTHLEPYQGTMARVLTHMKNREFGAAEDLIEGYLKRCTWWPDDEDEEPQVAEEELDDEMFAGDEGEERKEVSSRALELRKQAAELRRKAKALKHPPDYITQKRVRAAVAREKAEIHAETWEELVDLAEGARRENDPIKYMAIAQKLAETFNENELFNHTQYPRDLSAKESADGKEHKAGEFFANSAEGIDNFRLLILQEGFGISQQASMRFMSDMTDIAEQHNHHGIMRLYGTENGSYYRKDKEKWNDEVAAEKGKMTTFVVLSQDNRLGGYDEIPSLDYEADNLRVQLLQDNQLGYYVKNWMAIKFLHGRGQINPSQARAAAMPQNAARIIALAAELPEVEVEVKDANGKVVMTEVDDPEETGKKKRIPMVVNQRKEALRVLGDLFIGFGEQQAGVEDREYNNKALQRLFDADKISDDYRVSISKAQTNSAVPEKFRVFRI